MKLQLLSESCLLVTLSDNISEAVLGDIVFLERQLIDLKLPGVQELVPAYTSLAIYFDPLAISYLTLIDAVKQLPMELNKKQSIDNTRLWEIPVCYDEQFGIDLKEIAHLKKLDIETIIALHTKKTYTVYMLGFLPGFVYLGVIDPALQMDRKKHPRTNVAAGSVAIAGDQTGIYGIASPGGWQIIGRTPTTMLDVNNDPINPLKQGDKVRFFPISRNQFEAMQKSTSTNGNIA